MTNKLVVIINSLKYQKLRKFYYMKWTFLYQITAASRTPDWGATAPRSPLSLSTVLNWNCWTPPPRTKFQGTPLRSCTRFLIINGRCVWRIFVGLFVQVTKPDDITSSLYGWVSRTFAKINVGLMALGVENEIKKPAPGWTCNQPDKGVYY